MKDKGKSNYVFVFGDVASGKSTLIASLASYISKSFPVLLNVKDREKDQQNMLWKTLSYANEKKFPETTPVHVIQEIDFGLVLNDKFIPITFLELSGEDLRNLNYGENKSENISKELLEYISVSNIFLILIDPSNPNKSDILATEFINHLIQNGLAFSKSLGIVITKWDMISQEYSKNGEDVMPVYLRENLPMTFNWIMQNKFFKDVSIFTHSVGLVEDSEDYNQPKIVSIDYKYTSKIVEWIIDIITPKNEGKKKKLSFFETLIRLFE